MPLGVPLKYCRINSRIEISPLQTQQIQFKFRPEPGSFNPIAFYLLGEKQDDGKQCKILILLDNSSDEKALRLKRELEVKSVEGSLKSRRALFSIIYLVCIL